MYIYFKLSAWLILALLASVDSAAIDKDLTLTYKEKLILDKFGEVMRPRLPHDYMKKDIYLIRWLRARDFNLEQAERMLMNNLEWREKNNIDGILNEDFSDMAHEYNYHIKGVDVDGKPVVYVNVGEWNVRKTVLSGKAARLRRFSERYLEEVTSLVRKMQNEGANVTQYSFVVNMDGFNLIEHGCLQCIPSSLQFLITYENYYPGAADNMFLVNTPRVFEVLLNSVRFAMSKTSQDALKVYGTDKREWQPQLFKFIPKDQLPREVGGTKIYNDD